ncbi:ACT domain-containing protein [Marihabitans asiaticum]|uniref:Uncharacterized protein n=1 Tax=Marihabitans asiaticum TaxID=415218 RepID=A0A560WAY4_9MICO|nr:ACT domain-containing protein [Marihabitans asiaticum]TWD14645.1 hypothetical protein FB557_2064 [Marihabitans asiaticum]
MPLHLMQHPEQLAIARLAAGEDPTWPLASARFCSITRTPDETSVLCDAHLVPSGTRQEGPYVAFEVAGPLDFEMVGVMHELLGPTTQRRIPLLTMSTYDTDWILVPAERATDAATAWRKAGLVVTASSLSSWTPPPKEES